MAALKKVIVFTLVIMTIISITHSEEGDEPPNIAIIGAGVGGTTTAYYLRKLFGPDAKIDVFEKDRIGGRVATIDIDGQEYECGGSILHPLNEYMVNFTDMLGLQRIDADEGITGFFGKDGMAFQTSAWKVVTAAKMAWRYGYDIMKIQGWVQDTLLKNFARIYPLQNAGIAFTTVEELLRAMDEEFIRFTKITVRELFQENGFSEKFINELVLAAMRTNYGQNLDIPAFVGAVSMAGVQPGLFSVEGGNKQIPEKLFRKSKASLIDAEVTHVTLQKDSTGVSYELTYKNTGEEKEHTWEYDIVIMAMPLPTGQTDIVFEDFAQALRFPDVRMHETIALFVQGFPNISHFNYVSQDEFPGSILTIDEDVFFSSIGRKKPVHTKTHLVKESSTGEKVYKVFLNKTPNEQQVRLLFSGRKDLRLINWKAYPHYRTEMELSPFVLYDKLYYVNAMESAVSTLETSAIAGRNVALLAYNHWFGHLDKIDEIHLGESETKKEEL